MGARDGVPLSRLCVFLFNFIFKLSLWTLSKIERWRGRRWNGRRVVTVVRACSLSLPGDDARFGSFRFVPPCVRRRRRWLISRHRRLNRRRRREEEEDDDDGAGSMEAMKMREGCEEERTLGGVPRMKDDDDDDENVNNEETTTMCVWLRYQWLRWMSFSPGRRAPNVRVGR